MSLYIRGETGATLGPERQLLSALKIRDLNAEYGVLESDVLTWTARTADVNAGNTVIPDNGQKVSLYLDETRIFHGTVVNPTALLYGVKVSVEGAWWWLNRPDAVSDQDDGEGTTEERPTLVFPEQNLKTSIESLVDLASDGYGLPIRRGTVSSMFSIPRVSYSLQTLADVLADLLGWCADAVAWFDHSAESGECQAATATTIQLATGASATDDEYNGLEIEIRSGANAGETRVITDYVGATRTATISTAWTTTPTAGDDYTIEVACALNVTRRGDATGQTYTIGTDPLIEPFRFRPRVEYEVSQVQLPYATRDSVTGALQWASQESGSYTVGKRQIVPVAGPELADFLPSAVFESVTLDTTTTSLATAVRAAMNGFAELYADYPDGGSSWVFGVSNFSTTKTVTNTDGTTGSGATFNENPTPTSGRSFIIFENNADPPQWLIDDYGLTQYNVGQWYAVDGNSPTTSPTFNQARRQAILGTLGCTTYWNAGKTDPNAASPPSYIWLVNARANLKIWTIATADIPAGGIFYKLADFSFVSPPAGLAANLLATQNWVPWEGEITRKLPAIVAEQPLAKKFSISGSMTAAATAAALPNRYSLDFASRTATIHLGPPPRTDYGTLVGKTRRSPQDNIIEV